jgi:tetratricopeptide (TPR) repeat protein
MAASGGERTGDEKMKKLFLLMMALMALPVVVRAASLDDANAAFTAGKFAEATSGYEAVLKANGYSASVLFDLGNSYVRQGNYPQAILAYKRALWLAPNDDDILVNLHTAQQQAGTAVEQQQVWSKAANLLSVNGWAWLGCAAWTLLCGCLLLRGSYPVRRGWLTAAAVLCAFGLLDAILAIAVTSGGLRDAIVVDKNPQVLMSPFPGSADKAGFTLAPGATVKIEKAHNDFLWVADDAGHTGWMAKEQIEPVVR